MGKKTKERHAKKSKITVSKPPKSNDTSIIIWSFERIDHDGRFAFNLKRDDFQLENFFQKLLEFSTMKWSELFPPDKRKSRHHPLSLSALSKQAMERIQALKLSDEETDYIYSLALNGKARLIGIRKGAVFQVIWYDANHEFAPSSKKHT